jgi:hypothetical protein
MLAPALFLVDLPLPAQVQAARLGDAHECAALASSSYLDPAVATVLASSGSDLARAKSTARREPGASEEASEDAPSESILAAFAAGRFTAPTLPRSLARGRNVAAKRAALRVAGDAALVSREAAGSGPSATAALRNPVACPDVLVAALSSPIPEISLAAFCNPATDPVERRRRLTPGVADVLCSYGGNAGDRAIRGQVLAHANPWVARNAGVWNTHVRRGIVQFAHVDAAAVEAAALRPGSRYPGVHAHPALTGVVPAQLSTDELLAAGSPVLDLEALGRADATSAAVAGVFAGRAREGVHVEYLVWARAVARFGPGVAWEARKMLAATRTQAASWVTPAARWAGFVDEADMADARAAVQVMGSADEVAWETFMSLRRDWHGTLEELAAAALAV